MEKLLLFPTFWWKYSYFFLLFDENSYFFLLFLPVLLLDALLGGSLVPCPFWGGFTLPTTPGYPTPLSVTPGREMELVTRKRPGTRDNLHIPPPHTREQNGWQTPVKHYLPVTTVVSGNKCKQNPITVMLDAVLWQSRHVSTYTESLSTHLCRSRNRTMWTGIYKRIATLGLKY